MYSFTRCLLACFIVLMWGLRFWGRLGFLQLPKRKDYSLYGFFFPFPLTPDLFSHSPGSITPSDEVSFLYTHEFRSAVVLLLPFKFSFWRALDNKKYKFATDLLSMLLICFCLNPCKKLGPNPGTPEINRYI